jgi:hypothetical protein
MFKTNSLEKHETRVLIYLKPSTSTEALGSTPPLTEMSTRDLPGSKERWALKADNLTAICEPIL